MFCHNCGTQIPDGAAFCPNCGAKSAQSNTQTQNNASTTQPVNPFAGKAKFDKKKLLFIAAGIVALIAIIAVIGSISSNAGAKYQVVMGGGVSFKLFNDSDIGTYNGSLVKTEDDDGSAFLYDDKNEYIGEVSWGCEEKDTKKEATDEFNAAVALFNAYGLSMRTITSNGIKINIYEGDSGDDEYLALFVAGNYLYEIEFEDLPYDAVQKIVKTVNK